MASNPMSQVLRNFLKMTIQKGVYVLETKLIVSYDDINQAKPGLQPLHKADTAFQCLAPHSNLFSAHRMSCKMFIAQILSQCFTSIIRL